MPTGGMEAPRCLVVDDHPVVRAGVRAVLEEAFAGSAVTDAASIEDASDAFNGQPPDVVIVDPWRTGADVGEVVDRLQSDHGAPIVVFTSDGGARLLSDVRDEDVQIATTLKDEVNTFECREGFFPVHIAPAHDALRVHGISTVESLPECSLRRTFALVLVNHLQNMSLPHPTSLRRSRKERNRRQCLRF